MNDRTFSHNRRKRRKSHHHLTMFLLPFPDYSGVVCATNDGCSRYTEEDKRKIPLQPRRNGRQWLYPSSVRVGIYAFG